jgi:hypothetical protein
MSTLSNDDIRIFQIPAGKSVTVFSKHKDSAGYGYTKFCISGNKCKIHLIELICGNRCFDTLKPSLFSTVIAFPIMDNNILPAIIFHEYAIQCITDEAFTISFTRVRIEAPLYRSVFVYKYHRYDTFIIDNTTTYAPLNCCTVSTKIVCITTVPIFNILLQLDSTYMSVTSTDDMHHEVTFEDSVDFSKIDITRLHFKADKKGVLHILTEMEGCAEILHGMITTA